MRSMQSTRLEDSSVPTGYTNPPQPPVPVRDGACERQRWHASAKEMACERKEMLLSNTGSEDGGGMRG